MVLFAQTGGRAALDESLPFTTSFSVTGNYFVRGVDLAPGAAVGGFVTGTINVDSQAVPDNADILAAYLYWETINSGETAPAVPIGTKFRGEQITVEQARSRSSTELGSSFAPCWSSGGGSGATYVLTTNRADVLRFLPAQLDENGSPTGKRLVRDADLVKYGYPLHTVTLPEAGTGNQVPQSAGASLFVVYRDPSPTAKLTKVALYDGLFIQTQGVAMEQTIRGFLDAASTPVARLTHIVGSGAPNASDQVYFNGAPILPAGTNSFVRTSGGTSDRGWSNPTFNFTSLSGLQTDNVYGDSVTTKVDHGGNDTPNDCLAWAAIIFSTTVKDTDGDGLPDKLEDVSGLKEPNGQPLDDIHAMGASSTHKDVFLEVGAMKANPGTTYGSLAAPFSNAVDHVTDSAGHNHMPKPAVWKMLGDEFKNAPVSNPDLSTGIKLHVDVGPGYHGLGAAYLSPDADEYLVPSALARGGESILETLCVEDLTASPPKPCLFPAYPGTVGWKVGFQLYRDAPVGAAGDEISPDDPCVTAETCRRRFDRARRDVFHYALYAHALGRPKSVFPCLDSLGNPAPFGSDGSCSAAPNPEFYVPKTTGGYGDLPGGDFIITLGLWDTETFVASDFVQASTTMHEFGHNVDRWHGGDPPQISEVQVPVGSSTLTRAKLLAPPNCKPNYFSVMSYLFQVHGLVDDAGVPHLGYSNTVVDPIDETYLVDGVTVSSPYRTSWYAPRLPGTLAMLSPVAKKFCNGVSFPNPLPTGWVDHARINATSVSAPIDWNGNGSTADSGSQDVNFDGSLSGSLASPPTPLLGSNDWANLRLNRVGSRPNMAGFSLGVVDDGGAVGYEGGSVGWDGGAVGLDGGSVGWEGGAVGLDGGAVGYEGGAVGWDGGSVGWDGGAVGWDGGSVGLDGGAVGLDGGSVEIDFETLIASGYPSVNELHATLIEGAVCQPGALQSPAQCHRIRLSWTRPNAGNAIQYLAYRAVGATIGPATPVVQVGGPVPSVPGQAAYALVDGEELQNGPFTYVVYAQLPDGPDDDLLPDLSQPSFVTITAVNDAPVAVNDSFSTTVGVAVVLPVLGNDKDIDSPSLTASIVAGPSHGTLVPNANGSLTYTPASGFIGLDSFTYAANDKDPSRSSNVATVTIEVKPPFDGVQGVQNLPPPAGKTFKPGSNVTLKWLYTLNGVAVNSSTADPEVTVTGPGGVQLRITPQEPGHSVFKVPTASNGWTWQLNWQTDVTATGAALPPGLYVVTVRSRLTGLTLGPVGITLK